MQAKKHFSSSAGNLYEIVAANGKRLLIEMGVPWNKLQKALKYDLRNIEGALLTHLHADHSRAIKEVMRAGIDIYSSADTFEALGIALWRRTKVMADMTISKLPSFHVLAFEVEHDVPGALGFVVRELATDDYLLFATDMCMLRQAFIYPFSIIMLGCNYDSDILAQRVKDNDIHETVAKRLLFSHPSKQWVDEYLTKFCDLSRCREIHLLHMSGDNLDRKAVQEEIGKGRFVTVY